MESVTPLTVVGGAAIVVGGIVVLAARRTLPGPPDVAAGEVVVVAPVGSVVVVAPTGPLVVVAPVGSVVVVCVVPICLTGLNKTSPELPTSSRAAFWSFTPGRLTITVSPCRIISGSATPIESTRLRIMSTATSSAAGSKVPNGSSVTDAPP